MAGQAGWYRAPGEQGVLRYWDGTTWTHHRQPDPTATPAEPVAPAVLPEPDLSMEEYERQFTPATGIAVVEAPADPPALVMPQPHYRPQVPLYPDPQAVVPQPETELAGHAFVVRTFAPDAQAQPSAAEPQSFVAALLSDDEPDDTAVGQAPVVSAPVAAAHPVSAPELVAAAPARQRASVVGPIVGMGIGLVILLFGLGFWGVTSMASSVGAGEAKASGIVTSLGSTAGNTCTPVATFAVVGRSFTTKGVSSSPCAVSLGQSVDVDYVVADPASGAHLETGSSLIQFVWLVPIVGGLVFLGALVSFIARAGSVRAGLASIRRDRRAANAPLVAA